MNELVFDQKIDLPYTYTVGAAQRVFLRGLAEQKLFGSGDGVRLFVPARPFAPDGARLSELTEMPPRGVVLAVTQAYHLGGAVYALIRIEGSETPMLHRLDGDLPPGTPVEPVWEDEAEPGILALRCFRRAG